MSIKKLNRLSENAQRLVKDLSLKRKDMLSIRLKSLIKNHKNYSFPEFLDILRCFYGLGRPTVMEETGIPELTLYTFEKGKIDKVPNIYILKLLANYYDVDFELLRNKAHKYIKNKKIKKLRMAA